MVSGVRDFSVWQLWEGCDNNSHLLSWLATLAGPLFSFAIMWVGRHWRSANGLKMKELEFSWVFVNIPFRGIREAMKCAGDELVVARHLFQSDFSHTQIIVIVTCIVLSPGIPPIFTGFRLVHNRFSLLCIIAFFNIAIPIHFVVHSLGMNSILYNGFLSTLLIMATPSLSTLHTFVIMILLLLLRKNLFFIQSNQAK